MNADKNYKSVSFTANLLREAMYHSLSILLMGNQQGWLKNP